MIIRRILLNIFSVFVCSLRHPAYNDLAPYCDVWPVRLYEVY